MKWVLLVVAGLLVSSLVLAACTKTVEVPVPGPAGPAGATGAAGAAAPVVTAEVIKWRLVWQASSEDPSSVRIQQMCDDITNGSGGRLEIDFSTGGAIIPAKGEMDAVSNGVVDAAIGMHSWNNDKYPAAPALASTAGGPNAMQMLLWHLNGGGMELTREVYAPDPNIQIVAYTYADPPEIFVCSSIPLETPADMQGLKMRSVGDGAEIIGRMGGSMVFFPAGELYESMQRGIIDAFECGAWEVHIILGLHEVTTYAYESPLRSPTSVQPLVVNTESWNDLPSDLKRLVQIAAQAVGPSFFASSISKAEAFKQDHVDYGVIIEQLPTSIEQAFLAEAVDFYAEKTANDPLMGKIVESQRAWKAICEGQGVR